MMEGQNQADGFAVLAFMLEEESPEPFLLVELPWGKGIQVGINVLANLV